MDDIDRELGELIKNHCCITEEKHRKRLNEAVRMCIRCDKCMGRKIGDGEDRNIPPDDCFIEKHGECRDCEVRRWFLEHT